MWKDPDTSCSHCGTPFTNLPAPSPREGQPEISLTVEEWADLVERGSTTREQDAAHWRLSIVRMLVDDEHVGSDEAQSLALTITGMFDAGASDDEVVEFLTPALPGADSGVARELVARIDGSASRK
jgi:hypothetical protein